MAMVKGGGAIPGLGGADIAVNITETKAASNIETFKFRESCKYFCSGWEYIYLLLSFTI